MPYVIDELAILGLLFKGMMFVQRNWLREDGGVVTYLQSKTVPR